MSGTRKTVQSEHRLLFPPTGGFLGQGRGRVQPLQPPSALPAGPLPPGPEGQLQVTAGATPVTPGVKADTEPRRCHLLSPPVPWAGPLLPSFLRCLSPRLAPQDPPPPSWAPRGQPARSPRPLPALPLPLSLHPCRPLAPDVAWVLPTRSLAHRPWDGGLRSAGEGTPGPDKTLSPGVGGAFLMN